jgi:hypothetical protein
MAYPRVYHDSAEKRAAKGKIGVKSAPCAANVQGVAAAAAGAASAQSGAQPRMPKTPLSVHQQLILLTYRIPGVREGLTRAAAMV